MPSSSAACSRAGGGYPSEAGPLRSLQDAGLGLPKDLRLRQRKDFDNVFSHGRAWSGPLLVIRSMPNELGHNRYGFVTSKRLGGAVVRNRVRRRLREIVRECPETAGHDVVLSAKTTAPDASFDDLRLAVVELFSRAGLGVPAEEQI